jgi:hypothetical protein
MMGRRDVTIYTCDGCKATSTIAHGEAARGYTRVVLREQTVWLCGICYGAVEWVARFQGITVPPTVYGSGVSATLRPPLKN